jgi:hypothetical protein
MHLLYGVDDPNVTHFRLMDPNGGHLKPFPFEQLSCADFDSAFPRQIIDLQANFWYGRLIQLNPHYRQRIRELFAADGDPPGIEPEIYGALVRVLLEPSPSVLRAKCDIQQRLFGASTGGSGAPPLPCHALQVMSTQSSVNFGGNLQHLMQVRSMQVAVLVGNDGLVDFGAKTVACAANRARAGSKGTYTSAKKVFVAADRALGLQETLTALKDKGLEGVMQGEEGGLETRTNEREFLAGYMDMLLMADCGGNVVVTQHSTYGYTIAAMSKSSEIVYRQSIPANGTNCFGLRHREPVFHGWSTLLKEQVTCMTPELRSIIDMDNGMD